MNEAFSQLTEDIYHLVLLASEGDIESALKFCDQVRQTHPGIRIVLMARRTEYVPSGSAVDAVIREQSSPARFLETIRKVVELPPARGHSAFPPDESEN